MEFVSFDSEEGRERMRVDLGPTSLTPRTMTVSETVTEIGRILEEVYLRSARRSLDEVTPLLQMLERGQR